MDKLKRRSFSADGGEEKARDKFVIFEVANYPSNKLVCCVSIFSPSPSPTPISFK